MGCYSCGGNPNTFCRDCTYPKDTWIAPVDALPDPFMGDFDHLFRTPDGNMYALSPDRTQWILMGGSGGAVQRPQELELNSETRELSISKGNSITLPNDTQRLSISGRTITISNGNSINLPVDRDTVYNDSELRRRIQAVEDKADNFVSGVNVSRQGNKVKLTYNFVNGSPKEVEFEDKDTITLAYDDSALKARIASLENKPDKDTIYDDNELRNRIRNLEGRPQGTNQNLTLDPSTNTLTISGGNSVKLPNNKQTISKRGNKLILSDGGGEVDLPTSNNTVSYDDTSLRDRLSALESKPDKDSQTLSVSGNSLTISGGNTVTLPIPVAQTPVEVAVSDGLTVTKVGNKYTVSSKALLDRITALERKPDNDSQKLSISGNTLSLTNGGSVTLPTPDSYNDTDIKRRITALEGKADKDTVYNDTEVKNRLTALENRTLTGSVLRWAKGDIQGVNIGSSKTIQKSELFNSDGIKAGDLVQDYWLGNTGSNTELYEVTAVSGNSITIKKLGQWEYGNQRQTISKSGNKIVLSNGGGEVDIPTATPYNDADIKHRLGLLEVKADKDTIYDDSEIKRRLGLLESKRDNDNQTLSINKNTITISGGNSVTIPQPNLSNYVHIDAYNELKNALVTLLENLKGSGAWVQTGDNILVGRLSQDRNIATGNINIFGGQPDGNSFIRTNNGRTENDLAGGVN